MFSTKWDRFKLLPVFNTHSEFGKLFLGLATNWNFGNQEKKVCK